MMMDLQTSLIILGGVFVAGVITYNKWQSTRRARPWSAPFLRPMMMS